MLFVFEDNKSKALSKLYCLGYPESVSKNFIFAGGSGNLEKKIRNNIDNTDFMIVFIDIVPDNELAISKFYDLIELETKEFFGKLFILPIVCAEYYFIKSVSSCCLLRNVSSVNLCISRGFYMDDSEIKSE